MAITDDEMYRQLTADYLHHLQWREKLFAGFLVLTGALAIAFYHLQKKDAELRCFDWVIPMVGLFLSILFLLLDHRCHQILMARRRVGQAFEALALKKGLFASAQEASSDPSGISHSGTLEFIPSVPWFGFLFSFSTVSA